jgi:hypothetical protein
MIQRLLIAMLLGWMMAGCACLNRDNTPLVNAVERNLVLKSTPAKIVTAPVIVPVGVIAGLLDVFVVHPFSVIPDSAHDTYDALWEHRTGGYVTRMGSLVPLTALTPIVFTFDFAGRSMFDIPPYQHDAGEAQGRADNRAALLKMTAADLRAALERGDTLRVADWERAVGFDRQGDYTRQMCVVLDLALDNRWSGETLSTSRSLGRDALRYLSSDRYAANEAFLLELVQTKGPSDLKGEVITALARHHSLPASRLFLDRLTQRGLPTEEARSYINGVFSIGSPSDIDELLQRLRLPSTSAGKP